MHPSKLFFKMTPRPQPAHIRLPHQHIPDPPFGTTISHNHTNPAPPAKPTSSSARPPHYAALRAHEEDSPRDRLVSPWIDQDRADAAAGNTALREDAIERAGPARARRVRVPLSKGCSACRVYKGWGVRTEEAALVLSPFLSLVAQQPQPTTFTQRLSATRCSTSPLSPSSAPSPHTPSAPPGPYPQDRRLRHPYVRPSLRQDDPAADHGDPLTELLRDASPPGADAAAYAEALRHVLEALQRAGAEDLLSTSTMSLEAPAMTPSSFVSGLPESTLLPSPSSSVATETPLTTPLPTVTASLPASSASAAAETPAAPSLSIVALAVELPSSIAVPPTTTSSAVVGTPSSPSAPSALPTASSSALPDPSSSPASLPSPSAPVPSAAPASMTAAAANPALAAATADDLLLLEHIRHELAQLSRSPAAVWAAPEVRAELERVDELVEVIEAGLMDGGEGRCAGAGLMAVV